jgi:type III secretion protein V
MKAAGSASSDNWINRLRLGDIGLAIFVFSIAASLIVPLPPVLLDLLITLNLGFSLLLLLVGLYVPNSLALLTFPSILLLSTLFRLGLNVASCRLILSSGYAGQVIESFGRFLISGEVVVGIIIFSIVTVVNLIVIAKGAARVSEVAARFALEALPGKQIAIDSDLRNGLITPVEAHAQRDALRQESQLYGAMDGAMRFVQGDSVAGIFVIAANLLGGLYVGVSGGLGFGEAIRQYSVLTVGDGLVSQIPALLTSICAGLVVTRVDSGHGAPLSAELGHQLFSRPSALFFAGGLILTLSILPGMPFWPFALVGTSLVLLGAFVVRREGMAALVTDIGLRSNRSSSAVGLSQVPRVLGYSQREVTLLLDESVLAASYNADRVGHQVRWREFCYQGLASFGLQIPMLSIKIDRSLARGRFRIVVRGVEVERGDILPDSVFVEVGSECAPILGFTVLREERFPLSSKIGFWAPDDQYTKQLVQAGGLRCLSNIEYLFYRIVEFLIGAPEETIGLTDTHMMMKELERKIPGILTETVNSAVLDVARLTELTHELIREGVDVSDFRLLIEGVVSYCSSYRLLLSDGGEFDINHAVSYLRILRRRTILAKVATSRRSIKVCTLSSGVEAVFEQAPIESSLSPLSIPFQVAEALRQGLRLVVDPLNRSGIPPLVVLCRPDLRSRVSLFLRNERFHERAISFEEIETGFEIEQVGMWNSMF